MALTKTTTIGTIEISPATDTSAADTSNAKFPSVMVVYNDAMDDAEDADLPITATRVKHLNKFVEDGGAATSVSGEDALVQTICGAIWA